MTCCPKIGKLAAFPGLSGHPEARQAGAQRNDSSSFPRSTRALPSFRIYEIVRRSRSCFFRVFAATSTARGPFRASILNKPDCRPVFLGGIKVLTPRARPFRLYPKSSPCPLGIVAGVRGLRQVAFKPLWKEPDFEQVLFTTTNLLTPPRPWLHSNRNCCSALFDDFPVKTRRKDRACPFFPGFLGVKNRLKHSRALNWRFHKP